MVDGLAVAITVLSAGAALVVTGAAAAGRYRRAAATPTLAVLQAALVVQAVLDVVATGTGHRAAEPGTHLAYLVVSLVVLPLAAVETRHDDGTWSAVLLAIALAVTAVLVVRLAATWR